MSQDVSNQVQPSADSADDSRLPTHVVGIGASAGGLESLEQLFRHMPNNTGMAFVVIQHLSPDFKSMMNELLARDTNMRIAVAEDGMRAEADVIYLLPPRKEMIIADGSLHLSNKDLTRGLALPIDHFLESLARDCGDAAIAVILSGSGTDGTRGITEVSRRGGLVIAESLDTAKFDGMPSSAQATGQVDLTLSPDEIGNAIVAFRNDPSSLTRSRIAGGDNDPSLKGIDAIMQLFRSVYDLDFGAYKDSTVMRRIRRRLAMAHVDTFDQYADVLQSDSEELHSLYGDLLIGVTEFFRDPAVFDHLCQTVLPEVIARRKDDDCIRAWVAGCATGEEAYSVAIAFQEAMRISQISVPLKLFATDVHRRSIERASRGIFGADVLRQVPLERLERYFLPRSDGYQIRPEIRQMIVFAPHNVLRDAPFTDLDFVSCRNLLIYLRAAAQRRALSLFHYGLRVGGVLLLGSSESTGELAGEFNVISERYRLYGKARDVRLTQNLRSPLTSADALSPTIPQQTAVARTSAAAAPMRRIHDHLLNTLMPPSILIDSSRRVMDTFGSAEKMLRFPARQPSLDVIDLVHPPLRTPLSGLISRAIRDQTTARFGKIGLEQASDGGLIDLSVEPLLVHGDDPCFLIRFDRFRDADDAVSTQSAVNGTAAVVEESEASRDQIQQLEDDLRYSRENLQATIEELETSNEELQATNEELIASNEELQSTNEELHSLNEELYTVNSEHQRKIEELAELNHDMNHLLENTDVATVFLDSSLRIRRFTSRVSQIFELIDEDVGRSIHTFAAKLPIADLLTQLQTVLDAGRSLEQEVRAADDTAYLMRLLPYRTGDRIDGVVMMWIDISSVEALRGRLRWLSAIVESTSDAIIGQNPDGIIITWNSGAERLYGYSAEEIIGKPIEILIPHDRQEEVREYRQRILRGETVHSVDTIRLNRHGEPINVSLTVSPVVDSAGGLMGISKIARDIAPRIRMEEEIRNQVAQREHFLAMLSHELRNPFNAIRSASAVLSDERASLESRHAAEGTIGRQVTIVNHLLTDLLDVARVAENRINLKFEVFDLRELAQTVEEIVQSELDRHSCTIEFDTEPEPAVIRGDRTRLIQVQVNLIHNAAKYSDSGNPIVVSIRSEDDQVHLAVTDQGQGIPPENLQSIFEPFAQLDRSRERSDGGLGVGLTLAKSIVELHGGTIDAESAGPGRGSTFHIRLPRCHEGPPPTDSGQTSENGRLSTHSTTPPAAVKALRICVVEDMQDNREMVRTLLELDGHEAVAVANGQSAIDLLCSDSFDLALVDIGLPDMSGYDVARQVREEASADCRLVALTGYGQPSDVRRAQESGFDAHMVKPLDPAQLQELIAELSQGSAPPSDP